MLEVTVLLDDILLSLAKEPVLLAIKTSGDLIRLRYHVAPIVLKLCILT